ncbi:MAG: TrkA family potassium uptake protein [Planctomycetota bacterium]|nr:TrkA family potassium uptake protein [Planctomycetota bacterium]
MDFKQNQRRRDNQEAKTAAFGKLALDPRASADIIPSLRFRPAGSAGPGGIGERAAMHKRQRVCVIGLGQFGRHLAIELAKHCDVLVIDKDQAVINDIGELVQRAYCLDGRDFASLSSVVGGDFDEAVVSMSENMEASILTVLHLRRLKLPHIHAKATTRDHAEILKAIGADSIIFPERETAFRLATQLVNRNLLDFIPLSENYMVMQITPPEWAIDKTLLELNLRKLFDIFVIAVKEHVPERTVFLPGPDFVVKDSDALLIIGKRDSLEALEGAESPFDK